MQSSIFDAMPVPVYEVRYPSPPGVVVAHGAARAGRGGRPIPVPRDARENFRHLMAHQRPQLRHFGNVELWRGDEKVATYIRPRPR